MSFDWRDRRSVPSRGRVDKAVATAMIDDGPGAGFRWTLFTQGAHELYRRYGFVEPGDTAMVRPSARG